jgi:hypothetical protein
LRLRPRCIFVISLPERAACAQTAGRQANTYIVVSCLRGSSPLVVKCCFAARDRRYQLEGAV